MPDTQLSDEVRAAVEDTMEHFNANHADTVLLLARFVAGAPDATDAEAVAVDADGVDFAVVVDGRRTTARMAFATPATTADEVSAQVFGSIGQARQRAGEGYPVTSLEREFAEQGAIPTHLTEVLEVRDLTPNLREIVVGGAGLAAFRSLGGDQFAYVLVARPGRRLPDTYSMAQWMGEDPDTRPLGAYYTVRSWDPATSRMVLWAVLHGHADGVGGWFARCRPGDRLALWGPRGGFASDGVYAPSGNGPRHHLFVTDESGFCAVAALLDELDPDDAATVIAETVAEDHTIPFPGARTNVMWHYRGDAAPGTTRGLYDLAVQVAGGAAEHGAIATAFGAGESRVVSRIRKYLRHELGMPAAHVSMTGYWRRRH